MGRDFLFGLLDELGLSVLEERWVNFGRDLT